MAHTSGPHGWDFDGQGNEQAEVEEQARLFCEQNLDVIGPLMARIEWFKRQADSFLWYGGA